MTTPQRHPARLPAAIGRRVAIVVLALLAAACASPGGEREPGTVLVAGGSGRAGRYVLEELRRQGIPFRATTRSLAEAQARLGAAAAGVDWVEADLRDPAAVRAALAGIDSVISVIGSRELEGPNSAEFVDYGAVRNLALAARDAGVRQVVLLTAIGVTDPASPANKLFKGALEWRFKGEEALRASGVPYTIVRPAGLVDRPAGERGVVLAQGDDWRRFLRTTLSRADLAEVLVACLREPAARNATFEIANDAAIPPGNWRADLATLRRDEAGRDVK